MTSFIGTEYSDRRSGVLVREMVFERAGDIIDQHAHNFPHLQYLARGAAIARKHATVYGDGSTKAQERGAALERRITRWRDAPAWQVWAPWFARRYWRQWQGLTRERGPVVAEARLRADEPRKSWLLVEAFSFHSFEAEEDNTLGHCIFANRTPDGHVTIGHTGWGPAST